MSLPANWKFLWNLPPPASGLQPTGSTMLLQHVHAGNNATLVPTIRNAKSIGAFQVLAQLVYTFLEDGRNHPPYIVYQASFPLNSNRLADLFRFNVQSQGRNADWGSPSGQTKQGILQQWYGANTRSATTPLTLSLISTPAWVPLNGHHLFQGEWAMFLWLQRAPCIDWSIPAAGRQAYVVFEGKSPNDLPLKLGASCAAPPPPPTPPTPPKPPSPERFVELAEISGGLGAAAILSTFLLPGRYGRLVGPLRFIGVLLAATAAALGLASRLPSKGPKTFE